MDKEDKQNKQKTNLFWCDNGVCFTCKMCGSCCRGETGFIWISNVEKQAIAEHLAITKEELEKKYLYPVHGKWSIRELSAKQNFDCIFLKGDRCTIYPVRPSQCREFPFWESMLCDEEEWEFYASRCPGMNSGKHHTIEEIQKIIKEQKSKN
ncbi:MAG: YkgJ family cysteine cluster protein [Synergistaceae bacterium]|nr:YkgJ family cysteine cluster protein [Synergistaceae bacterium]